MFLFLKTVGFIIGFIIGCIPWVIIYGLFIYFVFFCLKNLFDYFDSEE